MENHSPAKDLSLRFAAGLGAAGFKKLADRLKSAEAIFSLLDKKARKEALLKAESEMEEADKHSVLMISYFDSRYPAILREIYDPPAALYVLGSLPADEMPKVAMVGSRMASSYGINMAKTIARDLSGLGICVVSGLALGIDSAAHEGALQGYSPTLAVLGNGLSFVHPKSNQKLAEKIIKNGALISEYAMNTEARPGFFPQRNRIVSGLSKAVLVVEAAKKSGALITASLAAEQGRDVLAVPGNADALRSSGTNALIKDGAKLVASAEDVLDEIHFGRVVKPTLKRISLTHEEEKIISAINQENTPADEILERAGLPPNRVLHLLFELEMKGVLKQSAGKNYSRIL